MIAARPHSQHENALVVMAQQVPGLTTTYEILKAGSGGASIAKGSHGTLHATGVVKESGKKFWSTKDPCARFPGDLMAHAPASSS